MSATGDLHILHSRDWTDYALLDSGNGQRLERYGNQILIRPDAEAIWKPGEPQRSWLNAHAQFQPSAEENGGHWERFKPGADEFTIAYKSLQMRIRLGASRHTGVFPEQAVQWDWTEALVREAGRPIEVLNLFGYTGLATLAAARGGARVTHLDASRKAISQARENQSLSSLSAAPIRWIVDDALKFVQREGRRGSMYDGIILDPPKFGRGPKGEVWDFYRLIPELLSACSQILSPRPLFVWLTAYSVKASALTLHTALDAMMTRFEGQSQAGEIVLKDQSQGRLLSTAVFARWSSQG